MLSWCSKEHFFESNHTSLHLKTVEIRFYLYVSSMYVFSYACDNKHHIEIYLYVKFQVIRILNLHVIECFCSLS